jgi:hypothetical protein
MTLTNAYATLAEFKIHLGINDAEDDVKAEDALNAASRQVDDHCGRRFWQDAAVATRVFRPDDSLCCYVDDISTTTGLVVKVDDGNGNYTDTLTINTHFVLKPYNAAADGWPFTEIQIVDGSAGYFPTGPRPGVQVTAKFGWATVPEPVRKATIDHAIKLFKSGDAALGGQGALGQPWELSDYSVGLLERYVKRY